MRKLSDIIATIFLLAAIDRYQNEKNIPDATQQGQVWYPSSSESITMLEVDEIPCIKPVGLEALDCSKHKKGREGWDV